MTPILLIGAGFSRNWGGWLSDQLFEFLLGDPAVAGSPLLRRLLWEYRDAGGFESAFSELRRRADACPRAYETELTLFTKSIRDMFALMNSALRERGIELHERLGGNRFREFLGRFSAIFTLNQDLLLEQIYFSDETGASDSFAWTKWQLPGMGPEEPDPATATYSMASTPWIETGDRNILSGLQPIFKLHGSSNWCTAGPAPSLLLGDSKEASVAGESILAWYWQEFMGRLVTPGTRLMVIGYGFRDRYINDAIAAALTRGLELFVIDPEGSDVALSLISSSPAASLFLPTFRASSVRESLIGASRRTLPEIFGRHGIEYRKVMHFFEPGHSSPGQEGCVSTDVFQGGHASAFPLLPHG